jgi:hypothetical protein
VDGPQAGKCFLLAVAVVEILRVEQAGHQVVAAMAVLDQVVQLQ